jgi:hypothetical protein
VQYSFLSELTRVTGEVDRVLSPTLLKDVPKAEVAMPHLADSDIRDLIDLLSREKRLGLLTWKSRRDQESAFSQSMRTAVVGGDDLGYLREKAQREMGSTFRSNVLLSPYYGDHGCD